MIFGPNVRVINHHRRQIDHLPSSYVDRPFPRANASFVDNLAAVHVGRSIPKEMTLYPGGDINWTPNLSHQGKSFSVKIPQIYSFATAGWVIPFDTCSRWNASPVTMIFPLRQILEAGIANVGPELMFLKPVQIPAALVNRDLIPEDDVIIRENKGKTKFIFYSGGKNETSLKLRREIANQIMAEMGFEHFEPIEKPFPIPSYNMRFYLNGKVFNYVSVFNNYDFKYSVSFGWELFSIKGGADLFYRYQGILLKGITQECTKVTIFNLDNLRKRIDAYLSQVLVNEAQIYIKIQCLLNDTEKLLHLFPSVSPDFTSDVVQEVLFYQWLEIFKNMTSREFAEYQTAFTRLFLKDVSDEVARPLLSNMSSIYNLVKHIEYYSPYLRRQLESIVSFETNYPKYRYSHIDLSPYIWKQVYKFYYCAPLDDEKILKEDIESFKKKFVASFVVQDTDEAEIIHISPFRNNAVVDLCDMFSCLDISQQNKIPTRDFLPSFTFNRRNYFPREQERTTEPRLYYFPYLHFTVDDWQDLTNGKIQNLIDKTNTFYRSHVYALAVCEGHFQYIANLDEDNKRFAIECAAKLGKKSAVQELLKVLPKDHEYYRLATAFRWAIDNGFFDIAQMLLRASPHQIPPDSKREAFRKVVEKEAFDTIDDLMTPSALDEISHYTIFHELDKALTASHSRKADKLIGIAETALNAKELGQILLQAARDNYYAITESYLRTHGNEVSESFRRQIREVVELKSENSHARSIAELLKSSSNPKLRFRAL